MAYQMKVILSIFLFTTTVSAKDLLPYQTHTHKGLMNTQSEMDLNYIDNEGLFLVPDEKGQHQSLLIYKAEELYSVPYLEVRYRGTGGEYKVEIQKNGRWKPVTVLKAEKDQWVRKKFELGDNVTAFASKKRNVLIRLTAKDKAETLEVDFLSITADEAQKNLQRIPASKKNKAR